MLGGKRSRKINCGIRGKSKCKSAKVSCKWSKKDGNGRFR